MRIQLKIPAVIIAFLLVIAFSLTFYANIQMRDSLMQEAQTRLMLSRSAKALELQEYLNSISEELEIIADSPTTIQAVKDFETAWAELKANQTNYLQDAYIRNNPNETGEKDRLYDAGDGSLYSETHAYYHPWFHKLQQTREYYDVFLFDLEGNLIYSVFKENDYATNFYNGPWHQTDLGAVFKAAVLETDRSKRAFEDFQPYGPSYDAPASFIARSVYDDENKKIGVLAFQMPAGRINTIMTERTGLGETGETYIVGADQLMRSESRFSDTSTILKGRVETRAVEEIFKGNSGVEIIQDYRGVSVLSAYQPIEFEGVRWGILAEIDKAEIEEPINLKTNDLLLASSILILSLGLLGYLIGSSVAKPVHSIATVASHLASGKLDTDIPYVDRRDEIGGLAKAIVNFRNNVIEGNQLREQAALSDKKRLELEEQTKRDQERHLAEQEERAKVARREQRQEMANQLEEGVADIVKELLKRVNLLSAASQTVERAARETVTKSANSIENATGAGASVQTVAAGAEEMSASVNEISARVQEASTITVDATQSAQSAAKQVALLTELSEKVCGVVTLIDDIAAQTNLLALNATIEASRAGDAGKGFAIVAEEVKSLAIQTADATQTIEHQIDEIRSSTKIATDAAGGVSRQMARISEISNEISAAVEQQSAATQEISRAANSAAHETDMAVDSIDTVAEAAKDNLKTMEAVDQAALELKQLTDSLEWKVSKFVTEMRVG